jgi:hypothetical protein
MVALFCESPTANQHHGYLILLLAAAHGGAPSRRKRPASRIVNSFTYDNSTIHR